MRLLYSKNALTTMLTGCGLFCLNMLVNIELAKGQDYANISHLYSVVNHSLNIYLGSTDPSAKQNTEVINLYSLDSFRLKEGKIFPWGQYKKLNGAYFNNELLNKKVVLINIWSTTCTSCVEDFQSLNVLYDTYNRNREIMFLSICLDSTNSVKKILAEHNFEFSLIVTSPDFLKETGIDYFPTNIFIDKNGITRDIIQTGKEIRNATMQNIDVEQFSKLIEKYLLE